MARQCEFVSDEGVPCGRPHNARGLCAGHGTQLRKGKELRPLKKRSKRGEHCYFVGAEGALCEKPVSAKGLCSAHYKQHRLTGWLRDIHKAKTVCIFVDDSGSCCEGQHYGCGLCKAHYEQYRMGESLKPLRITGETTCSFVDRNGDRCGRSYYGGGLCASHYSQRQRGSELKAIGSPGSKGYKIAKTGYFYFVAGRDWLKGGITNIPKARLSTHKSQGLIEVLHLWEYEDGSIPVDLEHLWTEHLDTLPDTDRPEKHDLKDGWTESIRRTVELEQWIEEVFKPLADDLLAAPLAA